MRGRPSKRLSIIIAVIFLLFAGYLILSRIYPVEHKEILTRFREKIIEKYPGSFKKIQARYGIRPVEEMNAEPAAVAGADAVILVHGLDDPGKTWINLTPVLVREGFIVWEFKYPNDQPVSESARFFFEEMEHLRRGNVPSVSIVSHSMGGLVAREMLTNPELLYSDAVLDGRVPHVSKLIMVAPPNHGSELARFRILMEFREQLSGIFKGEYIWLQGILDGAGEAGVELVPGSPFLDALNRRPHPASLAIVVIAGIMDVTSDESIDHFIGEVSKILPSSMHETVNAIGDFLNSMINGLGDGLVPVASAELEGYPLRIVRGTHLSIIRNIRGSSETVPPAIPVILEYLGEPLP